MKFFAIALSILILVGCADPFSSRSSEPPIGDAGTFIQPVSPQIVLINLQKSYEELIVANFMRCLDSNFVYHYDFAENQATTSDTTWALNDEIRVTESIFNSFLADSTKELRLSLQTLEDQLDQSHGDSAILYRSYIVSVITAADTQTPDTTVYTGTSTFTMVENQQGLWSIKTWNDHHQATDDLSWADYKYGYR